MAHSYSQQIRKFRQQALAALDTAPFSPQDREKILRYGAPVGAVLEHQVRLGRCMDRLQQLLVEAEARGEVLPGGTVVLADSLDGSNGRFSRSWHAPEGGLWLALAWPDILLPEFARLLPFAAGLACCRAVRSCRLDARLKWVNDVQVSGKKIAGILCETILSKAGDRYHLLGMGINVNNTAFPENLQGTAVGIAQSLGRKISLAAFTARVLAELTWALGLLHFDEEQALQEQGQVSVLLADWQQLCDSPGKRVEFGNDVQKAPLYQGVVSGFSSDGGLIMELPDGSMVTEHSGEIRYL